MGRAQPFVAVHVGAGRHAPRDDDAHAALCDAACERAMALLRAGGSALDAVQAAVAHLEADALTNAGVGSVLARDGRVYGDAGIMDGPSGRFGCVGAAPGIRSPVACARALLDGQAAGDSDAREYAAERGLETIEDQPPFSGPMVVPSSVSRYQRHYSEAFGTGVIDVSAPDKDAELGSSDPAGRIRNGADMSKLSNRNFEEIKSGHNGQENTHDEPSCAVPKRARAVKNQDDSATTQRPKYESEVSDTVGAIALDADGHVAAATSTGGISLKRVGRVGDAAVPGAGFWAADNSGTETLDAAYACSTTGVGEQIMRADVAREIYRALCARPRDDRGAVIAAVLSSFVRANAAERAGPGAGLVALVADADGHTEFWYAFTTPSMGFGSYAACDRRPRSAVVRRGAAPYVVCGSSVPRMRPPL